MDTFSKYQAPGSDLIKELREELVAGNYAQVDWPRARSFVREEDMYTPHTRVLETFFTVVNGYERVAPHWLRRRALNWIYEVLQKEDQFTNFICIGLSAPVSVLLPFFLLLMLRLLGPVNKMINMLCTYVREGFDSDLFRRHLERVPDYLWMVIIEGCLRDVIMLTPCLLLTRVIGIDFRP